MKKLEVLNLDLTHNYINDPGIACIGSALKNL